MTETVQTPVQFQYHAHSSAKGALYHAITVQ